MTGKELDIEARVVELRREARTRWLVKDELVFLLLHHRVIGLPLRHSVQLKPPSGSLVLYDTSLATDYKKDGYNWLKRKDSSGRVREDRAKLVINREVVVLGNYVHSAEISTFHRRSYYIRDLDQHIVLVHYLDESHKNLAPLAMPLGSLPVAATPRTTHADERIRLQTGNATTSMTTTERDKEESIESMVKNCFELDYMGSDVKPSELLSHPPSAQEAPEVDKDESSLSYFTPVAFGSNEFEEQLLYPESAPFMEDVHEAMLTNGISNIHPRSNNGSHASQSQPRILHHLIGISDFSPDWDFVDGGAKILICFEHPLTKIFEDGSMLNIVDGAPDQWRQEMLRQGLFVQFGLCQQVRAEKVSDTVLRCTAPRASSAQGGIVELCVLLFIPFLKKWVQISTTQQFSYRNSHPNENVDTSNPIHSSSLESNGVHGKRTRSPRSKSGDAVSVSNAESVDQGAAVAVNSGAFNANAATGAANGIMKNLFRDAKNLSSFAENELDERQCKIRVVERLSEFHKAIVFTTSSSSSSFQQMRSSTIAEFAPLSSQPTALDSALLAPSSSPTALSDLGEPLDDGSLVSPSSATLSTSSTSSASNNALLLDDVAMETMSDQQLETLSEKLLERVVQQLVTLAHTNEELLEELNSLDEAGLSLLHYVSFYNYAQLVPLLVSHGAHINQQSTQGQTSLHLAAGCGHLEVVKMLVRYNADLFVRDFDGLLPVDRAGKSGQAEAADYLKQLMMVEEEKRRESQVTLEWPETLTIHTPDEDVTMQNADATSSSLSSIDSGFGCFGDKQDGSGSVETEPSPSRQAAARHLADENEEHNRKLLLGAFSTMSLHDKCALSLSLNRDLPIPQHGSTRRRKRTSSTNSGSLDEERGSSVGNDHVGMEEGHESLRDAAGGADDVKSVIGEDEENLNRLEAAMELMGPEELMLLEEEAKVIQHNVRAWLLRRSYRKMRDTTKKLQEATATQRDQHFQSQVMHQEDKQRLRSFDEMDQIEREHAAAVTVQAATRTMLARRSFLQTKNVTIKVQAATRGVLCRKHFARMKTHALASLVIQRNVREWLNKNSPRKRRDREAPPSQQQPQPMEQEDQEEEEQKEEDGDH